ncbi:hypothetical protein B4Q13_16265 [Lacticaseibacillus rhamnosus]
MEAGRLLAQAPRSGGQIVDHLGHVGRDAIATMLWPESPADVVKKITDEDRARIFGLNAAKLYNVDVNAQRKAFPNDVLERVKQAYLEEGGMRENDAHGWVRKA